MLTGKRFSVREKCLCRRYAAVYLLGALLTAPAACGQTLVAPLPVSNQNPLVRIYGLPVPESAMLLSSGQQQLQLSADWASLFSKSRKGAEQLWLDGETALATLRWRFGWRGMQWGVDLPYLYQSGGALDQAIIQWHQLFGLPQADRDKVDRDHRNYFYINRDGNTDLSLSGHDAGLGDLRVNFSMPLKLPSRYPLSGRRLSVKTEVKLATGDSDRLRGSGAADLSVTLNYLQLLSGATQGYGAAGLLWSGTGDVLEQQRRHWMGFGTLGVSWRATDYLQLKMQLDGHTAFYHSDFDELDSSVQLSIGGDLQLDRDWQLTLAVTEDIVVSSAPDVVFHLDVQRQF